MIGQKVLIRSYASGVHFGVLVSETHTLSGLQVILENSRRIHYWAGAASLSQLAIEGTKKPNGCRIAMNLPKIRIENVIETIPLSEAAINNLENVEIWRIY
jgi:hypothetical protein